MGSRAAVTLFANAARAAGLSLEFLPSTSHFSFANSQTSRCWEKLRIWFKTEPPCCTDFEILEEGNVPLLLSLVQMRNLHFQFSFSPEAVYLTSKALG
jgi:hypothetical protein